MDREQAAGIAVRHRVSMLRLALAILRNGADAEDAVSEATLRALRKCASLREPEKAKPWLLTITARASYDILRRRKREIPLEDAPDIPVLACAEETLLDVLRRGVPGDYAQALVLFYYEGYSAKEIGGMLGMRTGAVTMRLSRGRDMLRRLLTKGGESE